MNVLMNYVGERKRFIAKSIRIGKKRRYDGKMVDTILIKRIIDATTWVELKDHAWIDYAPEIKKVNFELGDWLCFDATVGTYLKGIIVDKTNKTWKKENIQIDADLFGFQNVSVIRR